MGIFHRGPKPPDVTGMRRVNDVAGLAQALGFESPAVVKSAADAIGSVYREEPDPARSEAAGTSPALLEALARMEALISPDSASTVLSSVDADTAAWAILKALGEIRSSEAVAPLTALVTDSSAEPFQRAHAASALGAIGDTSAVGPLADLLHHPQVQRTTFESEETTQLRELRNAAAGALRYMGEAGINKLCAEVGVGGKAAGAALEALRTVSPDEPGGALAKSTVHTYDGAASEAERIERTLREKKQKAQSDQRRAANPEAAALADRLGHPEWLTPHGSLTPRSYSEALAACRSLGLEVQEHENVVNEKLSDVWSTVTTDGVSVTIDGGRRPRAALY